MGERILVVHFEKLRAETATVLKQITDFANIPADSARIENAILQADLRNVRKLEKKRLQTKSLGRPDDKKSFYRTGLSKNWKTYFTDDVTEKFLMASARAMKLANYQP